ncbi:MAG: ATP-binding cassette domain-containing protein [Streptosporangiaceae bacterium]|nr:ATP-binding cassette domain-containing protein [Streptosporangiaceae bacterium]
MGNDAAVQVTGLRKSYGELAAVDGIDIEIGAGEVFALLGPNGAGKTTTMEILEGFTPSARDRGGGSARPDGPGHRHRGAGRDGAVVSAGRPGDIYV